MKIFKREFPKRIKYLEVVSRVLLVIFLGAVIWSTICATDFEIYLLGKDITSVFWLSAWLVPLLLAISVEITSFVIQKRRHLSIAKTWKSFLKFLLPILLLSFFLSIVLVAPCSPPTRARDARIISAIHQSTEVMKNIYGAKANYDDFNCGYEDMIFWCQDIDQYYSQEAHTGLIVVITSKGYSERERDGKEPIISHDALMNSQASCIYSPLNIKRNYWYCADSEGNVGYTSVNPGSTGYCQEGKSARCPLEGTQIPADETANWRTYRNEEYRYEIKYPGNYKLSTRERTSFAPAIVSQSEDVIFTVLISDNPRLLPLNSWLKKNIGWIDISEWTPIKVDTVEGLKSTIQGNMDGGKDVDAFFLSSNAKKVYHLLFSTKKPGKENELKIFEQMISTFRFLE